MAGRIRVRSAVAAIVVAASLGAAQSAAGSTYTVDVFGDPNSLACGADPDPSPCHLRGAIKDARNHPTEPALIKLLQGTYALTIGAGEAGSPDNLNGDLDWADDGSGLSALTIEGAGSGLTTISATGLGDRIFDFWSGSVPVAINGMTLRGGRADILADGTSGGAIRTQMAGGLSLNDVHFIDNRTDDYFGLGGAISAEASLSLDRTYFYDNWASTFGGAIAVQAGLVGGAEALNISNSTFDRNKALHNNLDVAFSGGGAGIAVKGDGPGGLADPVATITNSTFDGNVADAYGGAIDTADGATTNLVSSTVTRNRANADEAGGELGGGLQNGFGTYTVKNSLILGNDIGIGGNSNCNGAFGSLGGNVVGDLDQCTGFAALGDLEFLAANLIGPLSANGGTTTTVPLLPGNPAIDHTFGCPAADQRGIARPQGAACDSGAFEVVVPPPPAAPGPTGRRAAALKKCRKKRSKKARKKCKKKAKRLPV
jgi:hypothetical protein